MIHSERQQLLDGIAYLLQHTRLSASSLAGKAGLSPSTITRFISRNDAPLLGTKTLHKLAIAAGFSDWSGVLLARQGFSEAEGTSFSMAPLLPAEDAIDIFERAQDLAFEQGYSREQAKQAANLAIRYARLSATSVTDHLILHFLSVGGSGM